MRIAPVLAAIVNTISAIATLASCTGSSVPTPPPAAPPPTRPTHLTATSTISPGMATLQARWATEATVGTFTPTPTDSPRLARLPPGSYVVYSAFDGTLDQFGNPSTSLYALPANNGPPVLWITGPQPGAALSPDGERLAYVQLEGRRSPFSADTTTSIVLLEIGTQTSRRSPQGHWGPYIDWSPDGAWIVMAVPRRLESGAFGAVLAVDTEVWATTTLIDCPLLPPPRYMSSCSSVASAPHGQWIAFSLGVGPGSEANGLYLFPADCVSTPATCSANLNGPFPLGLDVAWSPDGTLISSTTARIPPGPGIHILDPSSSQIVRTVPSTEDVNLVDGIAWSTDGSTLAFNSGSYLFLVNASTGEVEREMQMQNDSLIQVEFWLAIQ